MLYSDEIAKKALDTINIRRIKAIDESEKLRNELYINIPRLLEIEQELSATGISVAKLALTLKFKKEELDQKIEELRKANLKLQLERKEILESVGLDENALDVKYNCTECNDKGYKKNMEKCICLDREIYKEQLILGLNDFSRYRFENFSFKHYEREKERKKMEDDYYFLKNYAEKFKIGSHSMMLIGGTGLGKSHLAFSVANLIAERGYRVSIEIASDLFRSLEREYYGQSGWDECNMDNILKTDLLVLDDLGNEIAKNFNNFNAKTLYNIVNTRISRSKATIITTNLDMREIQDKYGKGIVSRILGHYKVMIFDGNDIRQVLRMEGGKNA